MSIKIKADCDRLTYQTIEAGNASYLTITH